VHFVQQGGHALHLVQHDRPLRRQGAQLQGQQPGIGNERLITRLVKQVDHVGIGELLASPGALAGATNAEQEEASLWRGQEAAITRCNHAVILRP